MAEIEEDVPVAAADAAAVEEEPVAVDEPSAESHGSPTRSKSRPRVPVLDSGLEDPAYVESRWQAQAALSEMLENLHEVLEVSAGEESARDEAPSKRP